MYIKIKTKIWDLSGLERKMLVTYDNNELWHTMNYKNVVIFYLYIRNSTQIYIFLYYFIVALRILTKAARALLKSIL